MLLYDHCVQLLVEVPATPDALFDYLDNPAHFGSPLAISPLTISALTPTPSQLQHEHDPHEGRTAGFATDIARLPPSLEEVVAERRRPHRKTLRAFGRPDLLVIGVYQLGFEIRPAGKFCILRVFVNYNHPSSGIGRLLGSMFGQFCARWWIRRVAEGVATHFQSAKAQPLSLKSQPE